MLTNCDTLGVEVGLDVAGVDTDPLKVNLVLDIGHEDEGRDNTLALGSGCLCANLAVPNIMCRGQQCTDGALGHGQESRLLAVAGVGVDGGHALRLPIDLGRVAEVLVDALDGRERVEAVCAGLADGAGHTRVERVRHEGVAASEAEGADTAITVHWQAVSEATTRKQRGRGTHASSMAHLAGSGCPWSTLRRRRRCQRGRRQRGL